MELELRPARVGCLGHTRSSASLGLNCDTRRGALIDGGGQTNHCYDDPFTTCLTEPARTRAALLRATRNRKAANVAEAVANLNDYEDDLWAFFMNCWHVKDWVKNDALLPEALRKTVVAAADSRAASPMVAVCADVANGIKHLTLNRTPHAGGAKITTFVMTPAVDGSSVSLNYFIQLDDDSYITAFDVGRAALMEWKHILQANGLALLPDWTDP